MTRIMKAGDFKAKCLQVMDQVAETGESVVITKHGRPVARLGPVVDRPQSILGFGRGMIEAVGDVISPVDVTWEAQDGGDGRRGLHEPSDP